MKIALVTDYLNEYGGAEKTFESFCELFPDAPVYTLLYDSSKMTPIINKMKIITSDLNKKRFFKNRERQVLKFTREIEQFDFSGFDVVLTSGSFSKGILTKPETKNIFYCHRMMRSLWDRHGEYAQSKGAFTKMALPYVTYNLRIWDFLAADRVDYFIANSDYTRKRIKKYYRRDSEIIYPPVDVKKFTPTKDKEDYYLFVSRLGPFDGAELVVDAFNKLGEKLVIIGDGPLKQKLQSQAKSNIDFLGFKPQDVLKEYYSFAKSFISVGEESFGLTEVEAMASGTPVCAYKSGGAMETIIPGVTGEFFNELSVDALLSAIKELNENYQKFDASKIAQHVQRFDKEEFKKKIKKFIESKTTK